MMIQQIKIEQIKTDSTQPRQYKDLEKIKDMAKSIRDHGVINAIEVDKEYVIVTGEMRYQSAKAAGLKTVPCKVIEISKEERFERQVVENVHHNTMSPWDTATAIVKLYNQLFYGKTPNPVRYEQKNLDTLSQKIGKSERWIRSQFEILGLDKETKKALREGKVSARTARALNTTPKEHRKKMKEKVMSGEIRSGSVISKINQRMRNYPDKAKEIIGINFESETLPTINEKLAKVAPTTEDLKKEDSKYFDKVEKAAQKLRDLLEENPFGEMSTQQFTSFWHRSSVVRDLKAVARIIPGWMKEVEKLKEAPENVIDL